MRRSHARGCGLDGGHLIVVEDDAEVDGVQLGAPPAEGVHPVVVRQHEAAQGIPTEAILRPAAGAALKMPRNNSALTPKTE